MMATRRSAETGEISSAKTTTDSRRWRRVVVLTRENDATAALVNTVATRCDEVITVVEKPQSRLQVARRRARRIGWVQVVGQLAFAALVVPVLSRRARSRVTSILASADVETTGPVAVRHVESVNAAATVEMLQELRPSLVVVLGTRVIAPEVLEAVDCPFVNLHAGITPRYRGLHGGYWALSEGRPDLVGTTVHVVDTGIDTGQVLGRVYFAVDPEDTIVTYPYLHLVRGLPVLAEQVERLLSDGRPEGSSPVVSGCSTDPAAGLTPGDSRLWSHPTLWGYLARRLVSGLR
jgi:methionyl-tRNA formyltransferase